jgi:hypothetical protein
MTFTPFRPISLLIVASLVLAACSDKPVAPAAKPTASAAAAPTAAPGKADLTAPLTLGGSSLPPHVVSLSGFSHAEPWGRWTDGPTARVDYAMALPKKFTLGIQLQYVYGENSAKPTLIKVGTATVPVTFNQSGKAYSVLIEHDGTAKSIEWVIPAPAAPAEVDKKPDGDKRKLGLGIAEVKVSP